MVKYEGKTWTFVVENDQMFLQLFKSVDSYDCIVCNAKFNRIQSILNHQKSKNHISKMIEKLDKFSQEKLESLFEKEKIEVTFYKTIKKISEINSRNFLKNWISKKKDEKIDDIKEASLPVENINNENHNNNDVLDFNDSDRDASDDLLDVNYAINKQNMNKCEGFNIDITQLCIDITQLLGK